MYTANLTGVNCSTFLFLADDDLLFYGIKKFFDKFHLMSIDENHSPEGDEWDFSMMGN